jgi:putative addiction module killer protein
METLLGTKIYGIIINRLERVALGDLGDWAPVGEGVSELRFHMSPGYRVYFGRDGDKIILLTGGTKGTQRRDIRKAKDLWSYYNA